MLLFYLGKLYLHAIGLSYDLISKLIILIHLYLRKLYLKMFLYLSEMYKYHQFKMRTVH